MNPMTSSYLHHDVIRSDIINPYMVMSSDVASVDAMVQEG